MTVDEVNAKGYNANDFIAKSAELRRIIEQIETGYFKTEKPHLFKVARADSFTAQDVANSLKYRDRFMLCADFDAYIACQQQVNEQEKWANMCLYNIASSGKFSTDYAKEIWGYAFIHYHRRHRHAAEPAQPADAGGEGAQEVMISSNYYLFSPPTYS